MALAVAVAAAAALVLGGCGSGGPNDHKYWVELDNAFGLTAGGDLKVAGVRAGKVDGFKLAPDNHALVQIEVNRAGFGPFRTDATCQTRPQSLIGEYFVDCQPGQGGRRLADGATIPVSHTASTVPPDLVGDILRLPYRERLRLIIGELGAGVAGNGADLNAAIRRAVPALRETDTLLAILAQQSEEITRLTRDANTAVGALADNKPGIQSFVRFGRRISEASASRQAALGQTFHDLPGFLEQLRPTMAALGRTADETTPTLRSLSAAAPDLQRFFANLGPFSAASQPALRALAKASVPGRQAVVAALPTVQLLRQFAKPAPELAGNLGIVLHDIDNPARAVENDPRAAVQVGRPGAKVGYSGLQALLMYTFDQSLSVSPFSQLGHMLRVWAFASPQCGPYENAVTFKRKLAANPGFSRCESWLGPSQPGLTRADPSDMSLIKSGQVTPASVPARAAAARSVSPAPPRARSAARRPSPRRSATSPAAPQPAASQPAATSAPAPSATSGPHVPARDATTLLNYLLAP
jgi:virulence factor Mce-like protein